jgi:iron complex outermembrane receptor protein
MNRNFDDHSYLPLTPPFTMANEIKLADNIGGRKIIRHYQLSLIHQWNANQNRVAPGEEKTAGTSLFNFNLGATFNFTKKWTADINLQVNNLLNTRYFNHISLYRRLNILEAGRNVRIFIRIPFKA